MNIRTGVRLLIRALLLTLAVTASPLRAAEPGAPDTTSVPENYRIGPGDLLKIVVVRIPEYSAEVPVRPDGKITTPGVEDMIAVNKTSTQLARDIEKVLAEIIRNPEVNVIVSNAISANNEVKVMGEVRQQIAIPYREGLRVMDAILKAGGLTDFAARKKGKIVRNINGKDTEIKVNLNDLFKGKMKDNHELRPGDVLIVPPTLF
jgi:polysaccharide export outer membrane protein